MTERSAAANEAARRLWARAGGGAGAPEEVFQVAARVCVQLQVGLSRWIGAAGYSALLNRALERAQGDHPRLRDAPYLNGEDQEIAVAVTPHEAAATTADVIALVTTLIEMLGRIVGDEMAVKLVQQTGAASPHRTSDPK